MSASAECAVTQVVVGLAYSDWIASWLRPPLLARTEAQGVSGTHQSAGSRTYAVHYSSLVSSLEKSGGRRVDG